MSDPNEPLPSEVESATCDCAMKYDSLGTHYASCRSKSREVQRAYRLGFATGHGELAGKHAEWCSRTCPCEAAIREAKGVGDVE